MAARPARQSSFMPLLRRSLRLWMARPHEDMPKAQAAQQFTDTTLVHLHLEGWGDLPLQIDPPLAHHTIRRQLRTTTNPLGHLFLLLSRQICWHTPLWGRPDIPAIPAALKRNTRSRSVCLAANPLTTQNQQMVVNSLPSAVVTKPDEPGIGGMMRREMAGEHPSWATTTQHEKDGVNDFAYGQPRLQSVLLEVGAEVAGWPIRRRSGRWGSADRPGRALTGFQGSTFGGQGSVIVQATSDSPLATNIGRLPERSETAS
jgi:hypothetical protein